MDATAAPVAQQTQIELDNITRAQSHDPSSDNNVQLKGAASSIHDHDEQGIEAQTVYVDLEDQFPEGGWKAWSVVLGAFLCLYPSFGFMVSIGTLQDYWFQHQLLGYSASQVAWIPSVFVYLALGLGIWVGPIFDRYGPALLARVGSLGYLVMMFLLAECTEYYQLMLCLGILGGVTGAMLTTTSLACVAHWFKAKRGFTQGIAMIGSSSGGLTIPLILRSTLPKVGYTWSIRILGFTFFACFVVGNILMVGRIPPKRDGKKQSIISLSIFADMRFTYLTVSVFCFEVVLFGALGIVPTYATLSTDYPEETGFYLISVMNGVSCLGRLLPGYASDYFGRFNTLLVFALFTLVIMAAVWLPFGEKSLGALYAFIALFGFGTGSWMALVPACIGQLCRADEFGRYYGTMYFVASLSTLVCIPISGALVQIIGPQALVGFYCAVLALGCTTFILSRWACLSYRWAWSTKV